MDHVNIRETLEQSLITIEKYFHNLENKNLQIVQQTN